jgi:hypothetical protein
VPDCDQQSSHSGTPRTRSSRSARPGRELTSRPNGFCEPRLLVETRQRPAEAHGRAEQVTSEQHLRPAPCPEADSASPVSNE